MDTMEDATRAFHDTLKLMPKETEKFMKAEATKLKRTAVKMAKHRVKKKTGNYLKGLRASRKVYKWEDAEWNVMVYNSARHAHLIENGHWLVLGGKKVAWVPGKFILKDSIQKFEPKFAYDVDNELCDFLARGLEK